MLTYIRTYLIAFSFFLVPGVKGQGSGNDVRALEPDEHRMLLTGSFDVGYTFHAGFDFGFHLGTGVNFFDLNGMPVFSGLSVVFRSFPYGGHRFKVISFNGMLQGTNRAQVLLGAARTWYDWGYQQRNTNASRGWGRYYDVNFRVVNSFYSPVIGFRSGKINNRCMSFVKENARSMYTGYRLDLFLIKDNVIGKGE